MNEYEFLLSSDRSKIVHHFLLNVRTQNEDEDLFFNKFKKDQCFGKYIFLFFDLFRLT